MDNKQTAPNLLLAAPTFGPLVPTCAKHGIGRTTAFQLAKAGSLDTFKIGTRTFVTLASLEALPERLRASSHQ